MPENQITEKDLKSALSEMSKTFQLKGIEALVEIYRECFGVPHLRAQTVHDAFFRQGFATAQDRLWHMDVDRHRAYGRLGGSAVEEDKLMRRFQIGATVRDDCRSVDAATRALLEAYTAGVNAFVGNSDALPIEYRLVDAQPERWQSWDCFAVFKVRHVTMGVFEGKLWRAGLVNTLGAGKGGQPPAGIPARPSGYRATGRGLQGPCSAGAG